MHNPHHRSKCLRQARNSAFTAPLVKMALPRLPPIAMLRRYSKKHLQHLLEQVNDLKSAVRSLEQQQDILLLQQHCLSCCCDVLHVLRLGSNGPVHPAWGPYSSTWLPGELPLLADLGWSTDKQSADNKDTLNVASTCLLAQRQQQQLQHQEQAVQRRLQLAASRSQTPQQQQSPMMMCCDEEEQEQALSSDGTESLSASWSDQLPFVRPMGAVSTSAADDGGGGSVPDCDPPAPAPAPAPAQATRVFLTPEGPLGVLKWTLEQPPYPGADRFTLSELVQCYSSTVKDMAFHLTLLAQQQELGDSSLGINASSSGCSQHLLALRSLVTQHTRRIATVLLLHPEDLLNSFRMVNLETGELSENPEEVCCCASLCCCLHMYVCKCRAETAAVGVMSSLPLQCIRP